MTDDTFETWIENADPTHLELIGKVTVHFSMLEGMVCELFRHYAGVSKKAGHSITGRLRMRQILTILPDLVQASQTNQKLIDDIADLKAEIVSIAEERDKIVHWEWMIGPDGPGITKFLTARDRPELPEIDHKSKDELHQLIGRMTTADTRICGHILPSEERAKMSPSNQKIFAPAPWLDKPE